jgi:hypothetical protein
MGLPIKVLDNGAGPAAPQVEIVVPVHNGEEHGSQVSPLAGSSPASQRGPMALAQPDGSI